MPLGDKMINSSLVERGRSLINPQPHPLLHFLIRTKLTSTNVFLQVTKNVEVTRRKIWTVWRMLKYFPAKCLKFIPHQTGSMGMGIIMQKDDSIRQHSREVWLYGTSQLILQPFRRFTYVTAHSATLPLLLLHHSSFYNPSVASPTSQFILQPFFRFSYVTSSSLNSSGELPMIRIEWWT